MYFRKHLIVLCNKTTFSLKTRLRKLSVNLRSYVWANALTGTVGHKMFFLQISYYRKSVFVMSTLIIDKLKTRLCPTEICCWKIIVVLCSVQWTSPCSMVCTWRKSYYYLNWNKMRSPSSQVKLEYFRGPVPLFPVRI